MDNKDIIFFDDDRARIFFYDDRAEELGFVLYSFNIASEALDHLKQRSDGPLAYFIDMKPYLEPEGGFTGRENEYPELPIPEEIFNYVRSCGWSTNHFYFVSGHRSAYNDEVLKRTRAKFIDKQLMFDKLEELSHIDD